MFSFYLRRFDFCETGGCGQVWVAQGSWSLGRVGLVCLSSAPTLGLVPLLSFGEPSTHPAVCTADPTPWG